MKKLINELKTLNPKYSRNISLASKIIRLSIKPEELVYPEGFYFDKQSCVITNKGNVPFWRTRKFNVLYVRRL